MSVAGARCRGAAPRTIPVSGFVLVHATDGAGGRTPDRHEWLRRRDGAVDRVPSETAGGCRADGLNGLGGQRATVRGRGV